MYSAQDKLKVVKRELVLRERNYPRWINQGKMKREDADREIGVMKAIVADYAILARWEVQGEKSSSLK